MSLHITLQEAKDNQPVAVIRGGKYSDEVVFLSEHADKPEGKQGPKEDQVNMQEYLKGYKPREKAQISQRLNKALKLGQQPESDISDIYHKITKKLESPRELILHDGGKFQPIPDPQERSVIYAFGSAGSGKSYFLKNYVLEWKKMHPKGKIYMFSEKAEDPSMDKDLKDMKRIPIDDTIAEDEITYKDFDENSMIIFDDIDSLSKKAYEGVSAILKSVLNVGRQRKLYVCVTSHLGSDYGKTRDILNETHAVVCYPHGSSAKALQYVLSTYCGLDKDQIKKIRKLPSRWVYVKKNYPPCVVYESGMYLLTSE